MESRNLAQRSDGLILITANVYTQQQELQYQQIISRLLLFIMKLGRRGVGFTQKEKNNMRFKCKKEKKSVLCIYSSVLQQKVSYKQTFLEILEFIVLLAAKILHTHLN